jgi:multiple sugar transport system permease protein
MRKQRIDWGRLLADLVVCGAVVIFAFPIFYIITTAFKDKFLAFTLPPAWIFKPTLSNFGLVFTKVGFFGNLKNSLIVASTTTLASLALGTPAAYALVRFRFRFKENLAFWILSTRMAPPIAIIIPFFLIARGSGLYDTRLGLIIIYTAFNLPLTIWMMRSFLEEIPVDLDEAVLIDGGTPLDAFWRVILPICAPALAATAILCFIFSWNEFLMAVILAGREAKTLPVMVTGYLQQTRGILWSEMSAASLLIMLPALLVTGFVQRYLVVGLSYGAVKG